MELINFNNCQQNQRMYGGTAGRKMGITYDGKDYLLKFPGNLKEQQMKNINLSYSEKNGVGVDLYEIIMTLQEHPFLQDIPGVKEHFWNMFVIDALIGNTDRNNSNWGIILKKDGSKR